MPLDKQVCNLDLATRLKELRVKQESLWSWWVATDLDDTPALNRSSKKNCPTCGHPQAPYFAEIAAFTVAELGEILRCSFRADLRTGQVKMGEGEWHTWINHPDKKLQGITAATEADARAKMLIYLIENQLMPAASQSSPSAPQSEQE